MMERRVKERLIGASILVVVVVGVVPEFLAGPKRVPVAAPLTASASGKSGAANEVRNITVDLATSRATQAPDAPDAGAQSAAAGPATDALAAAPPPEPHALSTEPHALPPEPRPQATEPPHAPPPEQHTATAAPHVPATEPRVPAAAPRVPQAPVVEAPSHAWSVQLGVFASKANADTLAHQVKSQGAAVYVVPYAVKGGAVHYKVRIGPLPDRGAAERSLARLKAQGHVGSLVAPEG